MAVRKGGSNLGTARRLGPRQRIVRMKSFLPGVKQLHQKAQLTIKR